MELSIVIPAYNVEKYIDTTIESLLSQSRKGDFEVIIINDGSNDNTLKVINKHISKVNKEYKVYTKENGGVSSARNYGLEKASGKYILFLDGDDYLSNNFIEKLFKHFEESQSDIIYWGFDLVSNKKETIKKFPSNLSVSDSLKFSGLEVLNNVICNQSAVLWTGSIAYKKDFINKENLKYTFGCVAGEDLEFIYRSLSKAKQVTFVNSTLSFYVQRDGSIMNSYNIRKFDSVKAIERVHDEFVKVKELKDLASILKHNSIPLNFIGNFRLSLQQLIKGKQIKWDQAINIVSNDLEKNYPDLKKQIFFEGNVNLKKLNINSLNTLIKLKIFKLSPKIHYFLGSINLRD